MRRGAGARGLTEPDVVPSLRDTHGQPWPWPPVADGESAAWLVFLPGAFTPVCTGELGWLGGLAEELAAQGVGVRVISCDAAPVLREVSERMGLPEECVLISDFWPHGAAARAFGLLDEATGRPRRVSVLIDKGGIELVRVVAELGEPRTGAQHKCPLLALKN